MCLLLTHPSFKRLPCVGGFNEVLKLDGAVGHEVIIADRRVVENGQLDLFPLVHVEAELLVVGRHVGFLLRVSLSDFVVVHLHHNVRVQGWGSFVEDDAVAEGEGGRLQVHRLADPQLQITIKLHCLNVDSLT